jgi:hypothetical protein
VVVGVEAFEMAARGLSVFRRAARRGFLESAKEERRSSRFTLPVEKDVSVLRD